MRYYIGFLIAVGLVTCGLIIGLHPVSTWQNMLIGGCGSALLPRQNYGCTGTHSTLSLVGAYGLIGFGLLVAALTPLYGKK